MKEEKLRLWMITNRGGKHLKPLNYFGYKLPIFFTKKEATAELKSMDKDDELKEKNRGKTLKGQKLFQRQIYPCTITYTPNPLKTNL